jgi:hypothetical protein
MALDPSVYRVRMRRAMFTGSWEGREQGSEGVEGAEDRKLITDNWESNGRRKFAVRRREIEIVQRGSGKRVNNADREKEL